MILKNFVEFKKHLPAQGKFLSLDVGTKRIGVATCDETQTISSPKKILNFDKNSKIFLEIKEIIDELKIKAIIIGFPVNIDATLNEMSFFVKKFVEELNKFLNNEAIICLCDERLTTFEAKEIGRLKHKKYVDDIAACIILQDFLRNIIS